MLAEKYSQEVNQILAKYPPEERRAAVMPLLHLVQRDQMVIDRKSMDEVAGILGISITDVASIVGFYTLFHDKLGGKFRIQVCTDLPCALRGADQFMEQLCERMGIEPGETTQDGLFTVEEVKCLAACDKAPMFQIQSENGLEYHENQTVENALSLIEGLRARIAHKGGLKRRQEHE